MKIGKSTYEFSKKPVIISHAAVVGKKEGEGPLRNEFDYIFPDSKTDADSWEKSESNLHHRAVSVAIEKSGFKKDEFDLVFSGDLLNQCSGTTFSIKDMNMPFIGIYGACSTMALSMLMSAIAVESGLIKKVIAATSSHFCSAEKQFRMPLEYGGQKPPTAQWTATAAGACVISDKGKGVRITKGTIGTIEDLGVKDSNNMGAAMAPAACETLHRFLDDTRTKPQDYDLIITGDLGAVGSRLMKDLLKREYKTDIDLNYTDCGLMLYNMDEQDVNSGGSGCGCSGAVICSNILRRMEAGELKKVLFIGTGALLSSVSPLQKETVPGIAHLICMES